VRGVIPVSFALEDCAPDQDTLAGAFSYPEVMVEPVVPGPGGYITTDQAARLAGVKPVTVRNWVNRGWHDEDGKVRKLPVAFRWRGRIMLDPREVQKAEHATAARARRLIRPTAA
jgi:hypothetical protein